MAIIAGTVAQPTGVIREAREANSGARKNPVRAFLRKEGPS
jgi:hypothetical protein